MHRFYHQAKAKYRREEFIPTILGMVIKDNQFDAVVSFEVFEHIFNISQILSELKRVLKPSGNLLISIPFSWNEHEAPYDFARYTSFGIKQILHENGFDVIELKKTTPYFLAIGQMFIAYLVQHIQPKNKWLGLLFQIGIIFPINLFTQTINFVLPKKFEYFCNIVVLARKQVRQLT